MSHIKTCPSGKSRGGRRIGLLLLLVLAQVTMTKVILSGRVALGGQVLFRRHAQFRSGGRP